MPANYNCPGQLVISGEVPAVEAACEALKEAGARRAVDAACRRRVPLAAHGARSRAFGPRLWKPQTILQPASCPVVQNVNATPEIRPRGHPPKPHLPSSPRPCAGPKPWSGSWRKGSTEVVEVGPRQGAARASSKRWTAACLRHRPLWLRLRPCSPLRKRRGWRNPFQWPRASSEGRGSPLTADRGRPGAGRWCA